MLVAAGVAGRDTERPADRPAVTPGNNAACAVASLARAVSTRFRATATVGLKAWAPSIKATKMGSFCAFHHSRRSVRLPPCGSGAFQSTGAGAVTEDGGMVRLQAVKARAHSAPTPLRINTIMGTRSYQCPPCASALTAVTKPTPASSQAICAAVWTALRRFCNCGIKSASATYMKLAEATTRK